MNAHKNLIDLLPEIHRFNDSDFRRYFFDLCSHNPKAIIDTYKRLNDKPVIDNKIQFLINILKNRHLLSLSSPEIALRPIVTFMGMKQSNNFHPVISSIKELRSVSGLGLKESKEIIDEYKMRFCE